MYQLWEEDAVLQESLHRIPLNRLVLFCSVFSVYLFVLYRIGQPDDCAGAVAFLVSDDASYITAETIVIAGGTQSRL